MHLQQATGREHGQCISLIMLLNLRVDVTCSSIHSLVHDLDEKLVGVGQQNSPAEERLPRLPQKLHLWTLSAEGHIGLVELG